MHECLYVFVLIVARGSDPMPEGRFTLVAHVFVVRCCFDCEEVFLVSLSLFRFVLLVVVRFTSGMDQYRARIAKCRRPTHRYSSTTGTAANVVRSVAIFTSYCLLSLFSSDKCFHSKKSHHGIDGRFHSPNLNHAWAWSRSVPWAEVF